MKKKILLTTLAISTLLAFSACSSDDNKDTDVATKTSEATEAPADNTDADETAAPDTTDTTEEPADVVESKKPGADEYHTVTDGDGNDITDQPTLAPPSLSDYPEGAYFDDNGNICIKEADGSERVLWDVYDGDVTNIEVEPTDPSDKSAIPIAYTKEDKKIKVVDKDGNIVEYLDSTDEDYIDVYNVDYITLQYLCYSPDTYEEKIAKYNQYTTSSLKENWVPENHSYNDNYLDSFIDDIAFNEDKSKCRVKEYVHCESDESGTMTEYTVFAWRDYEKVDGKWLETYAIEPELEKVLPNLS